MAETGYSFGQAVVESDTINFDGSVSTSGGNVKVCDALYVGTAGTVVGVLQTGATITFEAAAGALIPIRLIRVNTTSTDADLMVALYRV